MDVPDVDQQWHRIAADIGIATGHHLVLRLTAGEVDANWGRWWQGETLLDGERAGAFGLHFSSEGEAFVVDLAEHLQDHFSGSTWGGWPICPDHHNHPLEPILDEEPVAVWKCPVGRIVAKIGELPPCP